MLFDAPIIIFRYDLRQAILAEHSKLQCSKILGWIGDSQQRFDELFNLFMTDEYRVVQRAAWPLSFAVIDHPDFIRKHLSKLLKNLQRPGIHEAVKRNTVRLLQEIQIPKRFQGQVMDICFGYVTDPKEKPAVKAFSLTILENLSKQYPEISQELKTVIEARWEFETAAFRSRGKKILHRTENQKK